MKTLDEILEQLYNKTAEEFYWEGTSSDNPEEEVAEHREELVKEAKEQIKELLGL